MSRTKSLNQDMEATVQSVIIGKTTLKFPAGTSTDSVVGDSTGPSILGTNITQDQRTFVTEVVERTAGWGSGHDVEVNIELAGICKFSFKSKQDPKKTTKTVTKYNHATSARRARIMSAQRLRTPETLQAFCNRHQCRFTVTPSSVTIPNNASPDTR